jgi:hypothetical protein
LAIALVMTSSMAAGSAGFLAVSGGGDWDMCAAAVAAQPPELENGVVPESIRYNEQPSE